MTSMRNWLFTMSLAAGLLAWIPAPVSAQEPGWYPHVIAPPDVRPLIEATPMELRPYRPMHFWGNTVRRVYYRNNPLPLPRDWANTSNSLFRAVVPSAPAGLGWRRPGW